MPAIRMRSAPWSGWSGCRSFPDLPGCPGYYPVFFMNIRISTPNFHGKFLKCFTAPITSKDYHRQPTDPQSLPFWGLVSVARQPWRVCSLKDAGLLEVVRHATEFKLDQRLVKVAAEQAENDISQSRSKGGNS